MDKLIQKIKETPIEELTLKKEKLEARKTEAEEKVLEISKQIEQIDFLIKIVENG